MQPEIKQNKEKPIIEVRQLGKKYNIAHMKGGYIALRDVLANIFKSPFSFLKHKAKGVVGLNKKEEFWALRDLSFSIERGEIVGVIGHNGAGKSTLLKILSQITPPTEGEVILRGRVGSLLEVGTGFHPELTGRENIFLNGAILGMKKREIERKFNDIVEFAGIEKFLDTPVKHYSSGMYVRLAFSVAAHMEPDILLVDEVLAVGDAEFQKKCLGKMDEITKKEGRTILFVSHNMDAIKKICSKAILLKEGRVERFDKTERVIEDYLKKNNIFNSVTTFPTNTSLVGQITKISIINKDHKPSAQIPVGENFFIDIELDIRQKIEKKILFLYFYYEGEILLHSTEGDATGEYKDYQPGVYIIRVEIPAFTFQIGIVYLSVGLKHLSDGKGGIDNVKDIGIQILNEKNPKANIAGDNYWGKISTILTYKERKLS